VNRLEEPLKPFEAVFAFDAEQVVFVSLSRSMPPAGDQRGVVGDIVVSDESKARLLDEPLIDSGRHEEKQTDGAPEGQFVVGDRTGDDDRICEEGSTAGAKDAMPFPEHGEPIRKMIHRVDTEKRVEGTVVEGQVGVGVRKAESSSLFATPRGQLGGRGHSVLVGVDSRDATTEGASQVEGRSAGAAGDFEDVVVGGQVEGREKALVFIDG
jgi:hypothetical protein